MKSYTDIEQSKKLAEFLPVESVDMCYRIVAYNPNDTHVYQPYCFVGTLESDIPCWSLAALIGVLPLSLEIHNITDGHEMYYYVEIYTKEIYMKLKRMNKPEICLSTVYHENLVDACYEMILKLHELNLL